MVKLVAVGNRFMKDDGIAIKVVNRLERKLTGKDLEIIIGETDCQGSFYLLNKDDYVLILDALCIGAEPGSVHIFSLEEAVSHSSDFFMQHDMSLLELMKLYNNNFRGCMIGIEIAEIGYDDELSPVLRDKLPEICRDIEKAVNKIILEENINGEEL